MTIKNDNSLDTSNLAGSLFRCVLGQRSKRPHPIITAKMTGKFSSSLNAILTTSSFCLYKKDSGVSLTVFTTNL